MPNKNSHSQHTPQRTCVVCRKSRDISELISFIVIPEGLIFDPARRIQRRKHYVCPDPACLRGLDKWKRLYLKRNFGFKTGAPVFATAGTPAAQEKQE